MTGHDEAYWARKEQEKDNAERAAIRKADHDTSKAAAKKVEKSGLSVLQQRVLDVLKATPSGLTDCELRLACEELFGPSSESTYRKRRTDLFKKGLVEWTGEKRTNEGGNVEKVWRVVAPS